MSGGIYSELFPIIAPVFIVAAIGFAWARAGKAFDTNQLTPLITYVGTPFLLFSTLMNADIALGDLGFMALASLIVHLGSLVIGFIILKVMRLPLPPYLPALTFPNNGNMGLPLCYFAFGNEGLAFAISYFAISAIGQFTVGHAIASGHMSFKGLLRTPIIWSLILVIILRLGDIAVPVWANNTATLLGQFTIPLMLLALGVSLARLHIKTLGRSGIFAILRLIIGLGLGFGLTAILGLAGAERGVIIIQAVMPVAVFNYLFAQLHDNRPEEVAGIVVISTAMSFVVLPFILPLIL